MKIFLSILFTLLWLTCTCTWTPPEKITSSTAESSFPQIYIDPMTRITHMVWIENPSTEFKLVYSRKNPGGKPTTPIVLEARYRPRLSDIIGEGDGKHIMVTYDAKRAQGDSNDCTPEDERGCYEIYFIESLNGGDTWSRPVMITRDNLKDKKDRKGPKVVYVKENKMTFITYFCQGAMAFAKREGGGSFTKEIIMPFGERTAYQSMTYTVNPSTKKVKLHFTYTEWAYPLEWLLYTSSSDFGATWTDRRTLAINRHESNYDSYIRAFAVGDNDIVPGGIFVTFIRDNKVMLIWSKDEGNTWSRALNTNSDDAVAPRIQLCRQPNNRPPKVYLLFALRTSKERNSFVFGTLDTSTDTYKNNELPFTGLMFNWNYVVDCYLDGNKAVAAAIVESFDEDLNYIFLSYNDNVLP